MTYIITEPCIGTKDASCVEVCPVDCFHEGPNMLVIDPDECIDCTLCEPECPVEAILSEDDLTEDQYLIHPDECIDCGACEPECPVQAIFPDTDVPDEWTNYIEKNKDYFG